MNLWLNSLDTVPSISLEEMKTKGCCYRNDITRDYSGTAPPLSGPEDKQPHREPGWILTLGSDSSPGHLWWELLQHEHCCMAGGEGKEQPREKARTGQAMQWTKPGCSMERIVKWHQGVLSVQKAQKATHKNCMEMPAFWQNSHWTPSI